MNNLKCFLAIIGGFATLFTLGFLGVRVVCFVDQVSDVIERLPWAQRQYNDVLESMQNRIALLEKEQQRAKN